MRHDTVVGGAKKAGLYRFEEAGTDEGAFIDQSHSPSPHLILIRGQRDYLQLIGEADPFQNG